MIRALWKIAPSRLTKYQSYIPQHNLIFKSNLCSSPSGFKMSKLCTSSTIDPYNFSITASDNKHKIVFNKTENYIYTQKCNFAGRQRGLKRRKQKKETRRIQVSLGRRLELFYPKKAKQVRIRLVQNSRGNLIYDPVLKKFYVYYYKQGTQVFRSFRASAARFELAKAKAVNFARQMADFYSKKLNQIQNKYDNYYLENLKGIYNNPLIIVVKLNTT